MQSPRTHVLGTAALIIVLACGSANAAFPEKTITIVVPTAAGGANDAMARVIGQAMSAILKQPVIVDNKAGANGAIASEFVMRAPADGYTLMLGYIATHAMNPSLQKLRYDPVKDFEPVGMVGSSATLMVVSPTVKANDAKGVVALLKG
jgi:tripartite-type tricarboxylate transporter receptor subunit TctC